MTWKRVVLEIGMGTDIRGGDYTKAAVRALKDALWHNSLSVAKALGQPTDSMRVEVKIGETALAFFKATNHSDHPITGSAIFNVSPQQIAPYFNKIQCFCFTKQTLAPGASKEMPVTFFVDPKMADDIDTKNLSEVTLSYTFYRNDEPVAEVARGGNSGS